MDKNARPKKQSWWEDLPIQERCLHPEHHPPNMMVYPENKIYHHICPGCGTETVVRPRQITFKV